MELFNMPNNIFHTLYLRAVEKLQTDVGKKEFVEKQAVGEIVKGAGM